MQCPGQNSRSPHIRQLLYIYSSQLASRLKRTNPLGDIAVSRAKANIVSDSREDHVETQPQWHRLLNGWLDLIELIQVAFQALYSSLQSGLNAPNESRQAAMVRHFARSVSEWWHGFRSLDSM